MLNWEKLNFLGLETTWIGDFVQLSIILWNWLVWLIKLVIIFCYLSCVMINWSFCWDFWKWVFKIWFFILFYYIYIYIYINSMLKPILWFLKYNWTFLIALDHASCVGIIHASYRLLCFYFFSLTVFDVVCLWVFLLFLSFVSFLSVLFAL